MLTVCHCRSISLQYCIKQKVVRNLLNGYFLNNIYFLYFLYFSNNIFLMKGFVCFLLSNLKICFHHFWEWGIM